MGLGISSRFAKLQSTNDDNFLAKNPAFWSAAAFAGQEKTMTLQMGVRHGPAMFFFFIGKLGCPGAIGAQALALLVDREHHRMSGRLSPACSSIA